MEVEAVISRWSDQVPDSADACVQGMLELLPAAIRSRSRDPRVKRIYDLLVERLRVLAQNDDLEVVQALIRLEMDLGRDVPYRDANVLNLVWKILLDKLKSFPSSKACILKSLFDKVQSSSQGENIKLALFYLAKLGSCVDVIESLGRDEILVILKSLGRILERCTRNEADHSTFAPLLHKFCTACRKILDTASNAQVLVESCVNCDLFEYTVVLLLLSQCVLPIDNCTSIVQCLLKRDNLYEVFSREMRLLSCISSCICCLVQKCASKHLVDVQMLFLRGMCSPRFEVCAIILHVYSCILNDLAQNCLEKHIRFLIQAHGITKNSIVQKRIILLLVNTFRENIGKVSPMDYILSFEKFSNLALVQELDIVRDAIPEHHLARLVRLLQNWKDDKDPSILICQQIWNCSKPNSLSKLSTSIHSDTPKDLCLLMEGICKLISCSSKSIAHLVRSLCGIIANESAYIPLFLPMRKLEIHVLTFVHEIIVALQYQAERSFVSLCDLHLCLNHLANSSGICPQDIVVQTIFRTCSQIQEKLERDPRKPKDARLHWTWQNQIHIDVKLQAKRDLSSLVEKIECMKKRKTDLSSSFEDYLNCLSSEFCKIMESQK